MRAFAESQVGLEKDSTEWLHVLSSIQENLARHVDHFSELYKISPIDLKLRVLLHLPRYHPEELENHDLVYKEIARLAARTLELQREFKEWANQEPIGRLERNRAYVSEASEDTATIIHERFHYIGSVRTGRHFALYFAGQKTPAALATLSEMDVQKLKAYLPTPQEKRSILLSRMFSFRWAPPNSISYLLGKVGRRLKKEGQLESLLTWVNPNLGFHASSYRAANWTYVGSEPTTYRYIEGNYLTARQLFQKTQAPSFRIDTSQLRLAPLQVWYRRLTV
jgi:hypothetical protein